MPLEPEYPGNPVQADSADDADTLVAPTGHAIQAVELTEEVEGL